MKFLLLKASFFFLFLPALSMAGGGEGSVADQLAKQLEPYRSTSGLKSEVKKTFYQQYKDAADDSEGEISLFKGRLKIRINEPQESKSLLVVNHKSLWLETPMGEGFPTSVTKLPLANIKKSEGVWSVLIGKGAISKSFDVKLSDEKNGKKVTYELIPKGKANYELTKVVLEFKNDELVKLSYWDQLENRVSYEFEDWKKAEMSVKDFVYIPPKDASVTEL